MRSGVDSRPKVCYYQNRAPEGLLKNLSEAKPRPLYRMYYTYILKWLKNNEFYIGYTSDLKQRIKQHQGEGKLRLIYYEAYLSEKIARNRERKLKYYGSAWRALKQRIIA